MNVGEKIRMALRTFLRIEPAPRRQYQLQETLDRNGRAIACRLWYHGDGEELSAFYRQLPSQSAQRFWSAVPSRGREIRKIHTGLPREIIDVLVNMIIADMNEVEVADKGKAELWAKIAGENGFRDLVSRALTGCMVVGDGAFKISFDPDISEYPILEWRDGDQVEFVLRRGRMWEMIFDTLYPKGYTLREHYGYGYVRYELFRGEYRVELSVLPETAALEDVTFDRRLMMAVPLVIKPSDRCPGRGSSFFDGKTDAFDALDEAWSQWVQAMRSARPREYIPQSLIPRDPDSGALLRPNPFDNQFISTAGSLAEGAEPRIVLDQAAFYAEQYNSTYVTALDLALQGLVSPSTLGIDTKKLDNAEAQREKEKTTLYTRQMVISALSGVLEKLVDTALKAHEEQSGRPVTDTECSVSWGEYANPSFEAVVETLSNPNTPMSVQAKVEELWGSAKDDAWKQDEVLRILREQGMEPVEEPSVGGALL